MFFLVPKAALALLLVLGLILAWRGVRRRLIRARPSAPGPTRGAVVFQALLRAYLGRSSRER